MSATQSYSKGKYLPVPNQSPTLLPISLLGQKNFSPPLPFNLCICTGDWLIEFLLFFLPAVHWCISAFLCILYKYRPLCMSYLLYKKRTKFVVPLGASGQVGLKIVQPFELGSASNWAPFSRLKWQNRILTRHLFQNLFLNCLPHFYVDGTGSFSPTNNMYLICSKEAVCGDYSPKRNGDRFPCLQSLSLFYVHCPHGHGRWGEPHNNCRLRDLISVYSISI